MDNDLLYNGTVDNGSTLSDDVMELPVEENFFPYEGVPRPAAPIDEDPYYSWTNDEVAPISKKEVEKVFHELGRMFGFQPDNVCNMYEHFMVQLDSRASRMAATTALLTLHADYIGGVDANYRKWYFCCQIDDDDLFSDINVDTLKRKFLYEDPLVDGFYPQSVIEVAEHRWRERMRTLTTLDRVRQIALYLMLWGEANNIRFMPECLCFIFQCALDHMTEALCHGTKQRLPPLDYLNRVITPLYNFYRDQQFQLIDGVYIRKEKDHNAIIGYDDMNQLFWYHQGLARLKVKMKGKVTGKDRPKALVAFPKEDRYDLLGSIDWSKAFYKTYKETRTWLHLFTNFSRVWIIHLNVFWYFSSFNSPSLYTYDYQQLWDNQPKLETKFSVVSLGSTVGLLIEILSSIFEWLFVPTKWPGAHSISLRLSVLIALLVINAGPSVFVLGIVPPDAQSQLALIVSIVQFCISILTTIWLCIQPLSNLAAWSFSRSKKVGYDPIRTFAACYPKLDWTGRVLSVCLWIFVFGAKFAESYFFLTLSLRDPIRNLHVMDIRCIGDSLIGNILCRHQGHITLGLMYLADVVLFFLDTYLWYIIWNCLLSLTLSFSSGISILSPWRNVFTRLPQRIYSKLLSTADMEVKYKPDMLVSQIWNAIVISLYREHLLSSDHVHHLIYDQLPDDDSGRIALRTPSFFLFQDDSNDAMSDFFVPNSEAERRISFFAQSLSTSMPEPIPVEAMPSFTVLIPHYSEKILLQLREIIKEDPHSKISLLEYLKQMFPHEWQFFVRDTKILSCNDCFPQSEFQTSEEQYLESKVSDLPLYCIGFKSVDPEYTLRTRIWASLRCQTLYRTISGFMNYRKAIKLLHRVENPEMIEYFGGIDNAERYLDIISSRKFRLLVCMQRLQKFTESENADLHILLKAYPDIQVSSLETEVVDDKTTRYYACLYDVVEGLTDCQLRQVYRIQLSGNPILGDGKSDNQNNSIIFYRGEYLQVIDANQDNYLEECLKIRSVLAEFETLDGDDSNPYLPNDGSHSRRSTSPVAILGAREYIFSEHTGVLGDVAASKEQTFGTMFARTLAVIGAKLHYGHPDFINAIFMTTRGGISKAQKGLHLNEDIYAGMTAICRGGRIKHCDYFQCGKGRDLGFGSILNFTTKIGGGMGEQMLSREYYYLGTYMPLDRFLSFYYAHPGFHLNNLFIMLSLSIFMLVAVNMGAMKHELIMCMYDKDIPITDLQKPLGCQNLQPVLDWVTRYVLSIFICFFISFLPLVLHELSERGPWKAAQRLLMHFASLSPLFEVFVCQIYATSLKNDIVFGGARYIATGRGFSITRNSFCTLYSSYAPACIYPGMRLFLILLFAVMTMWQPAILWFWITFASLCFSPFLFNPHQFSWTEFFLDYGQLIRWFSRGNSRSDENSWVGYTRMVRSRITGFKKQRRAVVNGSTSNCARPAFLNVFFADCITPLLEASAVAIAYMFINAQSGVRLPVESNSLIRLVLVVLTPFILNGAILLGLFPISCIGGPLLKRCCAHGVPSTLAAIAHVSGLVVHIITFQVIWLLESWNPARALACFTASIFLERFLIESSKILILSRELREEYSNQAWWSGQWIMEDVEWRYAFTQPLREYFVKIMELSLFASDFIITHIILMCLTPALFVPYIDVWHSCMLMWIKPSNRLRGPVYTVSQEKTRRWRARRYCLLYILVVIFLVAVIICPIVVGNEFGAQIGKYTPQNNWGLVQANWQNNNDTGPNAPSYVLRQKPALPKPRKYRI